MPKPLAPTPKLLANLRSPRWARRLLRAVVALLIVAAASSAVVADQFRVATYNLENLLDEHDDPYSRDERTDPKPRDEIRKIAKAIRHVNADVIAFQEVENEGIIKDMNRRYLRSMHYRHVVVEPTNSRYGINLGVLSRRPIVRITSHRFLEFPDPAGGRPHRFARDLLQVEIQVNPQQTLYLFVVHLKRPQGEKADNWRLAEAQAAAGIVRGVEKENPRAWLAVVGDFNDKPGSAVLKTFLENSTGQPRFLVDVHDGQPAGKRVTYLKRPHRGTIDYILASPNLARWASAPETGVLDREDFLDGSDHAPVWATFRFPGPETVGVEDR